MDLVLLRQALGGGYSPSDAVINDLCAFLQMVEKWNGSINLVAKSTLQDAWKRHVVDSAQLFHCARADHRLWMDMGSGGGFPAIVIAVLAKAYLPDLRVSLVESDKRKSVFFSQVLRVLKLNATVLVSRVEALPPQSACVVSARALAPVGVLCSFAAPHLRPGGTCAFLKGEAAAEEVAAAREDWSFDLDCLASLTEPRASVLFLRGLAHV